MGDKIFENIDVFKIVRVQTINVCQEFQERREGLWERKSIWS